MIIGCSQVTFKLILMIKMDFQTSHKWMEWKPRIWTMEQVSFFLFFIFPNKGTSLWGLKAATYLPAGWSQSKPNRRLNKAKKDWKRRDTMPAGSSKKVPPPNSTSNNLVNGVCSRVFCIPVVLDLEAVSPHHVERQQTGLRMNVRLPRKAYNKI